MKLWTSASTVARFTLNDDAALTEKLNMYCDQVRAAVMFVIATLWHCACLFLDLPAGTPQLTRARFYVCFPCVSCSARSIRECGAAAVARRAWQGSEQDPVRLCAAVCRLAVIKVFNAKLARVLPFFDSADISGHDAGVRA